ncbi:MAG: hypothetical protein E6K54_08895 [Gammaproteobacteria bacterium]|nr:MAG: hypothetical protein E6K54_08895 [Gammaproteobacteria bacterium]
MKNSEVDEIFTHPDLVTEGDHRNIITPLYSTLPAKLRDFTIANIKTMFNIGYYALRHKSDVSWEDDDKDADVIRACKVLYELIEIVVSRTTNSHDWKYYIKDELFNVGIYPSHFRDLNTRYNWPRMKILIGASCEMHDIVE